MAITYSDGQRNAVVDAQVGRLNGGKVQIFKGGGATLVVEFALGNPAFGGATVGQRTLNGAPISGTAAAATTSGDTLTGKIIDSSASDEVTGFAVAQGTGTPPDGTIYLDNTTLTVGQTVNLNGFTFTVPASV